MQNYSELQSDEKIRESYGKIAQNDRTIMSNHSSSTFPILDPSLDVELIGMLFYKTDETKTYQLIGFKNDGSGDAIWKLFNDGTADYKSFLIYRGVIASSFNFNSYTKSGIYKVSIANSWGGCQNYPYAQTPSDKTKTIVAGTSGIFVVTEASGVITQKYTDTVTGSVFTRSYNGNGTWPVVWSLDWSTKTLTKMSQLINTSDGTDSDSKKFVTFGDITSSFIISNLGYTPVNVTQINLSTNNETSTTPSWDDTIPVISNNGVLEIGRYIDFHSSETESRDYSMRFDAGILGSNTMTLYGRANANGVPTPANFLTYGDITAFSDERLKTDIEDITDAVEKVKKIRGVTFKRTDAPDDSPRQAGVIAQEVEKVLPEVIRKVNKVDANNEEYLTVAYGNMIGLLIEAIKEQQKAIEQLMKICGVEKHTPKKRVRKTVKKKAE